MIILSNLNFFIYRSHSFPSDFNDQYRPSIHWFHTWSVYKLYDIKVLDSKLLEAEDLAGSGLLDPVCGDGLEIAFRTDMFFFYTTVIYLAK